MTRWNVFWVVVLIIVLLAVPLVLEGYYLHLGAMVFLYILLTSSLRTIFISGQMSLGHAGFMAIGAYTSAILAIRLGWPLLCTMLLGACAAALVAGLIGFPFSRLRAIYFSMASLFFGIVVISSVGLAPELTGHYTGLYGIPRLFGYGKTPYYYFFLILSACALFILYRIENSRLGMTMKCVAQSHLAASSRGINEGGIRILALTIGAFFAGLAGGAYAHFSGFISPPTFGIMPNILLVVYLLVGGKDSFGGPVVGAALLYLIPFIMGGFKEFAPFIQAGILIAVLFLMPRGLIGLPRQVASVVEKILLRWRNAPHAASNS